MRAYIIKRLRRSDGSRIHTHRGGPRFETGGGEGWEVNFQHRPVARNPATHACVCAWQLKIYFF